MKRKHFSVEQITGVLQQVGAGVPVGDVCRQVGVSEQTFYRWKKEYGGMIRGVVARIVTGPHEAHRQDPHRPMRYDTGRPRAVIRFRISQPRTASLPCPAGLRARRLSPMMDL